MEEKAVRVLAPSGVSPWDHKGAVVEGKLTLYWKQGGREVIRTFTREETANLLNLLYDERSEILKNE